jgi:hypothetical protein
MPYSCRHSCSCKLTKTVFSTCFHRNRHERNRGLHFKCTSACPCWGQVKDQSGTSIRTIAATATSTTTTALATLASAAATTTTVTAMQPPNVNTAVRKLIDLPCITFAPSALMEKSPVHENFSSSSSSSHVGSLSSFTSNSFSSSSSESPWVDTPFPYLTAVMDDLCIHPVRHYHIHEFQQPLTARKDIACVGFHRLFHIPVDVYQHQFTALALSASENQLMAGEEKATYAAMLQLQNTGVRGAGVHSEEDFLQGMRECTRSSSSASSTSRPAIRYLRDIQRHSFWLETDVPDIHRVIDEREAPIAQQQKIAGYAVYDPPSPFPPFIESPFNTLTFARCPWSVLSLVPNYVNSQGKMKDWYCCNFAGATTPFTYAKTQYAFFQVHTEQCFLPLYNYLHYGTQIWFTVDYKYRKQLEAYVVEW